MECLSVCCFFWPLGGHCALPAEGNGARSLVASPGNSLWRAVIPLEVPSEGRGGDQTGLSPVSRGQTSGTWGAKRPLFRLSSSARREDRSAQWEITLPCRLRRRGTRGYSANERKRGLGQPSGRASFPWATNIIKKASGSCSKKKLINYLNARNSSC